MNVKDTCTNGKFRTTNHKTIMKHLRLQADLFRRQGRLKDDKMETIIEELIKDMEIDGCRGQNKESTRLDKHKRVMEAVDKGLLQVH